MNLKQNIQRSNIGVYLMLFAVFLMLSIGGWYVARWVNWNYGYRNLSNAAICDMVKSEALIDPTVCD